MSFRGPSARNLSTPKENLDDTKRRRIGGTASKLPPTNPRAKSVLGDNSSDVASINGGIIEFNTKEDVELLLAEKLRTKKNDFKGKSEQQTEYIKKLRACIQWQMEQVDKQFAEQELLKKSLESETALKLEIESELRKKINEQTETIEKLTKNCESLELSLKKEISEKTAVIESFEKEKELKKMAENSVKELNQDLSKSKEELQQVSDQLKTVQDNIKRLTEYNNSLQIYNSTLQSEGAKKDVLIQRVQKEKSAMIDSMGGLKEQINKLKNQLDSSKVSQQEAINQKESLKNEINFMRNELNSVSEIRDIKCLEVEKLTKQIESLEKDTGTTFNALNNSIAEVTFLEETTKSQREQIGLLTRQLSTANEKLKLADISAGETYSEFEETKKRLKIVEEKLFEAEQRISDGEDLRKKLHNTILELKGNIRVFCRVRPAFNDTETNSISFPTCTESAGRGIDIITQDKKYDFTFDKVFNQESSQEDVFVEISQLVQSALDGYKVCIFAYGQTGSGKTYTMMGNLQSDPEKGLIPRSLEQIFVTSQKLIKQGWKYKMQASMLEIYDENIFDLLLSNNGKKNEVAIRHDDKNSYVIGLTCKDVFSIKDVSSLLKQAAEKRSVGKTQMNEQSSRSHFVFTLRIDGSNEGTEQKVHGVLNLIDLAGSERLDKSCSTGERLKETQFINKSLSALSDVIFSLAKKDKGGHVPYRNSKLTDLLQPCLGGDSKTLMFVNVSPELSSAGETLCSLRFAARVNSCEIGIPRRQT